MESHLRDKIEELYNKFQVPIDGEIEESVFNKEKHEQMFKKLNIIILSLLVDSFKALIAREKLNESFDLNKFNELIKSPDNLINIYKVYINLAWQEHFEKNQTEINRLIQEIFDVDVLRHIKCIFNHLKNMGKFCINHISRITFSKEQNNDLSGINSLDELEERVKRVFNSILVINMTSCLEDEDDLTCIDCRSAENPIVENREYYWF